MRKIITGIIAIVFVGVLGWNTYSICQLKEQMKKQNNTISIRKNYKEDVPLEKDGYSDEEDADEPYMLLLMEEVKNEESAMMQKDLGQDIENIPTYIMDGSATLCYSSRDKVKD